MPHSYGASFAADGRFGASRWDMSRLIAPNTTASSSRMMTGRYWLIATVGGSGGRSSSPSSRRDRWSAAVGDECAFATVEEPAQGEEDDARSEHQDEGRLAAGAEVAHHVDV